MSNFQKSQFRREITPPSTPPPSSALHSAFINPSGFCSATRVSKAEAETDGGRGERGPEKGEREAWLDRFVDMLVTRFGCPIENGSYRTFCAKYPRRILEEAYARVCDTPRERIRKSQGALFVYLVKTLSK
jgi:hypothetical protein